MSYHQSQSLENRTEELQIDANIDLSERINLFIEQNTYFFSNSPNDLILSCTNISLALLYFGMPNNLRRLLLYATLNFPIAVTVEQNNIKAEIFEQSTFQFPFSRKAFLRDMQIAPGRVLIYHSHIGYEPASLTVHPPPE